MLVQRPINVLIGVQARSTSHRFPNKVHELIGDKRVLDHVILAAMNAKEYLENFTKKVKLDIRLAVLTPQNDRILSEYAPQGLQLLPGPEDDVLSRYYMAAVKFGSDYIVRITGDCPLIPSYVISRHVQLAIMNDLDYVSNVWPEYRVSFDGQDCEVISRRVLDWLNVEAQGTDREHCTTLFRKSEPRWARIGHVVGHIDLKDLKLSLDTKEDLELIREHYRRVNEVIETAERKHGKRSVYRL